MEVKIRTYPLPVELCRAISVRAAQTGHPATDIVAHILASALGVHIDAQAYGDAVSEHHRRVRRRAKGVAS